MIKAVAKIGNSHGIIFDAAIMELAHLKVGDQVNVEVHEGGAITISALRPRVSKETFAKELKGVLKDYRSTLRRLA